MLIALLLCVPVWFFASWIVVHTATPGADAKVAGYFSIAFIATGLASATLYLYARRFFVEVDGTSLRFRKWFSTQSIHFHQIDKITLKTLNNGLQRISIHGRDGGVLRIASIIEGFSEFRALIEHRARTFGIPMEHG
jgi:hypothetical protein